MAETVSFIIAGTQKGGTTALDAYLRKHPEIQMARKKEVHFFDNEKQFAVTPDYDAYYAAFPAAENDKIRGEATPIYMYWKDAPQRIHTYNPNMKWILLLRDPISRAYSHWNMERERGYDTLCFSDAIRTESQRCLEAAPLQHRIYSYTDRGFYSEQIQRIWEYFPKKQVLILRSDDLKQNPQKTLDQITHFIDVKPLKNVEEQRIHARPYPNTISDEDNTALNTFYTEERKKLYTMLGWNV